MPLHIPAEFVEKYNKAGPRYTSYPTVPAWDQDFGEKEYRKALTELNGRTDDELAIYLHLPFCAKACHYCGCNMLVTRDKGAVHHYLDRVEKELERVTSIIGTGRKVAQFHWGGGTPNYLNERRDRAGPESVPVGLRHQDRRRGVAGDRSSHRHARTGGVSAPGRLQPDQPGRSGFRQGHPEGHRPQPEP